ncbi:hypothetical protein [Longirhabdus pacifica]|uniref:hypothetical protein n=1 Tax=Longirhabdus pacifica TaxID=2305227 RepID=UPI0010092ABF|nr:hypothetical protein [Longirhabdus pacifica]
MKIRTSTFYLLLFAFVVLFSFTQLGDAVEANTIEESKFVMESMKPMESNEMMELSTDFISAIPQAPSYVNLQSYSSYIYLNWNNVSYANGYKVKRSTTSGGPYTTVRDNVYGFQTSFSDYNTE